MKKLSFRSIFEIFSFMVFQDFLRFFIIGSNQITDSHKSDILYLLFFRREFLKLLLKFLIILLSLVFVFVWHKSTHMAVVALISVCFLLSFHDFSALRKNWSPSFGQIAHMTLVIA